MVHLSIKHVGRGGPKIAKHSIAVTRAEEEKVDNAIQGAGLPESDPLRQRLEALNPSMDNASRLKHRLSSLQGKLNKPKLVNFTL